MYYGHHYSARHISCSGRSPCYPGAPLPCSSVPASRQAAPSVQTTFAPTCPCRNDSGPGGSRSTACHCQCRSRRMVDGFRRPATNSIRDTCAGAEPRSRAGARSRRSSACGTRGGKCRLVAFRQHQRPSSQNLLSWLKRRWGKSLTRRPISTAMAMPAKSILARAGNWTYSAACVVGAKRRLPSTKLRRPMRLQHSWLWRHRPSTFTSASVDCKPALTLHTGRYKRSRTCSQLSTFFMAKGWQPNIKGDRLKARLPRSRHPYRFSRQVWTQR
ncbi:hypothetical protein SAMN04244579_01396 [Azotobacter beijerinckii]|uniref:Uncharacterized protein n=1 Tax=Azotobacter beijerinckii TaxID=170623 RepID=A0A1H6S234_9GAMM|nr:hypothetical protein SAMN04244579_01396 [Azotobacter beijerinckii]